METHADWLIEITGPGAIRAGEEMLVRRGPAFYLETLIGVFSNGYSASSNSGDHRGTGVFGQDKVEISQEIKQYGDGKLHVCVMYIVPK